MAKTAATAPATIFRDVTIVDVIDGRLIPAQTVVVIGTRIHAVGPTSKIRDPQNAQVVNAQGKYLIPGLWDMHIHPMGYPNVFYPLLIANGVTGIRDASTTVPIDTLLHWRREVATGLRVGPRQVVAGKALNNEKFTASFPSGNVLRVATPAEAQRTVESLKAAGVDFIKIREIPRAAYFAAAAAARQAGLPFGGHLGGEGTINGGVSKPEDVVSAAEAADSGASILDHNAGMYGICMGKTASLERCTILAEQLRRTGTWVVPTLFFSFFGFEVTGGFGAPGKGSLYPISYRAKPLRFWPSSMYRHYNNPGDSSVAPPRPKQVPDDFRMDIMQRAGIPLLAGTDVGPSVVPTFVPGFSLHDELGNLVWAGVTPLDALQAATINPARALRATDSLGTVAPGKLADLVLLDANPLIDISNTAQIRAVMANGRYFDRTALDRLLAEVELAAGKP